MHIPDRFPPGCQFVATFSGDEFVRIPGSGWYKASDNGTTLIHLPGMADSGPYGPAAPMSEAGFLASAEKSRAFATANAAGTFSMPPPEEATKVPAKFPEGCRFGMDLNDGDGVELSYVEFPDGKRFVLNEKTGMYLPTTWWPMRWSRLTEAEFVESARNAGATFADE